VPRLMPLPLDRKGWVVARASWVRVRVRVRVRVCVCERDRKDVMVASYCGLRGIQKPGPSQGREGFHRQP
jgi:hypothetical protein